MNFKYVGGRITEPKEPHLKLSNNYYFYKCRSSTDLTVSNIKASIIH